jgi:hypothetical protein
LRRAPQPSCSASSRCSVRRSVPGLARR